MIIYTAITDNYDSLKEQLSINANKLNFFAFLDSQCYSETWSAKPATTLFSNPRLNAKHHKIMSHLYFPDEEITLWIDGSVEISCLESTLRDLESNFLQGADIAVFAHNQRYCLYQEAAACIHHRKDDAYKIYQQVARYTQLGFPAGIGLAECTIVLRRNSQKIKYFNEFWWNEILTGSIRDQISFPYAVWKTGIKINYIPGRVGDGTLFLRRDHLINIS